MVEQKEKGRKKEEEVIQRSETNISGVKLISTTVLLETLL